MRHTSFQLLSAKPIGSRYSAKFRHFLAMPSPSYAGMIVIVLGTQSYKRLGGSQDQSSRAAAHNHATVTVNNNRSVRNTIPSLGSKSSMSYHKKPRLHSAVDVDAIPWTCRNENALHPSDY